MRVLSSVVVLILSCSQIAECFRDSGANTCTYPNDFVGGNNPGPGVPNEFGGFKINVYNSNDQSASEVFFYQPGASYTVKISSTTAYDGFLLQSNSGPAKPAPGSNQGPGRAGTGTFTFSATNIYQRVLACREDTNQNQGPDWAVTHTSARYNQPRLEDQFTWRAPVGNNLGTITFRLVGVRGPTTPGSQLLEWYGSEPTTITKTLFPASAGADTGSYYDGNWRIDSGNFVDTGFFVDSGYFIDSGYFVDSGYMVDSGVDGKLVMNCMYDADCLDGDLCTEDVCVAGDCQHNFIEGCCKSDIDCNDGDFCTTDICMGLQGCRYQDSPGCCRSNDECRDNDACTLDFCQNGQCINPLLNVGPATTDCCRSDNECTNFNNDACIIGTCANTINGLTNNSPRDETLGCVYNERGQGCCSNNAQCVQRLVGVIGTCEEAFCDANTLGFPQCSQRRITNNIRECCDAPGAVNTGLFGNQAAECDDGNICTRDVCTPGASTLVGRNLPACVSTPYPTQGGVRCCSVNTDCGGFVNDRCQIAVCQANPNFVDASGLIAPRICVAISNPNNPGCCRSNADCDDSIACTVNRCVEVNIGFGETGFQCDFTQISTQFPCCTVDGNCNDGDRCTIDVCDNLVNQPVFGPNPLWECRRPPTFPNPNEFPDCCRNDAECQVGVGACITSTCQVDNFNPLVTGGFRCVDQDRTGDSCCLTDADCFNFPDGDSICRPGRCVRPTGNLGAPGTCRYDLVSADCCRSNANCPEVDNLLCTNRICSINNRCVFATEDPNCCETNNQCAVRNGNPRCFNWLCQETVIFGGVTRSCVSSSVVPSGGPECCEPSNPNACAGLRNACNNVVCAVDTTNNGFTYPRCIVTPKPECCLTTFDAARVCNDNPTDCVDVTCVPGLANGCRRTDIAECCESDGECGLRDHPRARDICYTPFCTPFEKRCVYNFNFGQDGCCQQNDDCFDGRLCFEPLCVNSRCQYRERDNCCDPQVPGICNDNDQCTRDVCNGIAGCQFIRDPGDNHGECCYTDEDCNDDRICTEDMCGFEQDADLGRGSYRCMHRPVPTAFGVQCCEPTGPFQTNCAALRPDICTTATCVGVLGCRYDVIPDCCKTDADCVDNDLCTEDKCILDAPGGPECRNREIPGCRCLKIYNDCMDEAIADCPVGEVCRCMNQAMVCAEKANCCRNSPEVRDVCRASFEFEQICSIDVACSCDDIGFYGICPSRLLMCPEEWAEENCSSRPRNDACRARHCPEFTEETLLMEHECFYAENLEDQGDVTVVDGQ